MQRFLLIAAILIAGCDRSTGGKSSAAAATCGLAALAGPTALLGQFGIPDQTPRFPTPQASGASRRPVGGRPGLSRDRGTI